MNTGHTIHYSGTVGAAREANISGYPAIAISIEWAPRGGLMYFNDVAIYSLSLVELVLQESEKNPEQARQTVWNANFPNVPISKILGWKYTKQGASCIKNQYKLHHSEINPEGELMKQSYRLIGALQLDDLTEEYDTYAVLHKYASVSLLGLFHRHKNDHQNFISQCENWSIFSNKSNTEA